MIAEPSFKAVLVRHGQTEWSVAGRHTGSSDIPLTPEGELEATTIATRLEAHDFATVLCSPLVRARLTCEIAGFAGAAQSRDELREWDYGDYEGLTTPQILRSSPDWQLWRDGCPGGESPDEISARCDRVVGELLELASGDAGDAILFAHGHLLRALAARWCELPVTAGRRLMLGTAAICTLGFERQTRAIKEWNVCP